MPSASGCPFPRRSRDARRRVRRDLVRRARVRSRNPLAPGSRRRRRFRRLPTTTRAVSPPISSIASSWATSRFSAARTRWRHAPISRPRAMRATRGFARRAAEVALAARMRGLAQESAKLWACSIRRPSVRSRSWRRSPPVTVRQVRRRTFDNDVKSRLEKALADAAFTERGPGEIFLQLNRLAATRSTSARSTSSCAISPSRIPRMPRRTSRWRSPRITGVRRRHPTMLALEEIDRALALKPDWERAALLKSESSRARSPTRRLFSSRFSSRPIRKRAPRPARSRSSSRAKALRRGARGVPAAVGQRPQRARVRVRRRRDLDADEGLGDGRIAVPDLKRANYGDNGAVELYLAQIAEEKRQLPGSDRALQGRARGRSRAGSRNCASPR